MQSSGRKPSIGGWFQLCTPSIDMLMCDEVGCSDVHALIKELAIRWVENSSETHSDESQHLVEGTEVAHLWQRFSFVLQRVLPFRMRHHLCRKGVALTSTRQIRLQRPVCSVDLKPGSVGPEL